MSGCNETMKKTKQMSTCGEAVSQHKHDPHHSDSLERGNGGNKRLHAPLTRRMRYKVNKPNLAYTYASPMPIYHVRKGPDGRAERSSA